MAPNTSSARNLPPRTLGIDFGTSNSAAGIAVAGQPYLIQMEPGETTLPTAVFFEEGKRDMRVGRSATRALIDGDEGRFMRALKSLLGTPLLQEERRLGGERISFATLISRFLATLKTRAEAHTRMEFTHALSGRPVKFHSKDEARNIQAEQDLRACYHAAGFHDVMFLNEPEAALRAASVKPGLGLIVDIGGGTSDFTAFEQDAAGHTRVLASHGARIGGTDFDRQISIDHVMPLLGRGSEIKNAFGGGTMPAPNRLFNDLATWQMIPFLYTGETRRMASDLAAHAVERAKLDLLVEVLEHELGHDLAFAVERGKISANSHNSARIDLKVLKSGLGADLDAAGMARSLTPAVLDIRTCAVETLALAQVAPDQITRVVLVGGSSLLGAVRQHMQGLCPNATLESEKAMTAVADGLALAAEGAFS